MPLASDHYRRQNDASRKAVTEATVAARKQGWKDAGLLDDIPRERVVETDPTLWKGPPWWVTRAWVRWSANVLLLVTIVNIVRVAMAGEAFALAYWIPLALFAFQLRWHIARHGG